MLHRLLQTTICSGGARRRLCAPRWRRDSERRSKALKLTSREAGRTHQKRQPTLNDPCKLKAPYNPRERISEEADRLRGAALARRRTCFGVYAYLATGCCGHFMAAGRAAASAWAI